MEGDVHVLVAARDVERINGDSEVVGVNLVEVVLEVADRRVVRTVEGRRIVADVDMHVAHYPLVGGLRGEDKLSVVVPRDRASVDALTRVKSLRHRATATARVDHDGEVDVEVAMVAVEGNGVTIGGLLRNGAGQPGRKAEVGVLAVGANSDLHGRAEAAKCNHTALVEGSGYGSKVAVHSGEVRPILGVDLASVAVAVQLRLRGTLGSGGGEATEGDVHVEGDVAVLRAAGEGRGAGVGVEVEARGLGLVEENEVRGDARQPQGVRVQCTVAVQVGNRRRWLVLRLQCNGHSQQGGERQERTGVHYSRLLFSGLSKMM
mmetsp:Transcript_12049/g.48542  ORF Transcript_12049/g.48542 Transcript_12049/m.48542 type:complete len:319 (-) Transcript_12049:94-1050(-)